MEGRAAGGPRPFRDPRIDPSPLGANGSEPPPPVRPGRRSGDDWETFRARGRLANNCGHMTRQFSLNSLSTAPQSLLRLYRATSSDAAIVFQTKMSLRESSKRERAQREGAERERRERERRERGRRERESRGSAEREREGDAHETQRLTRCERDRRALGS